MMPQYVFFTKGQGRSRESLQSFEAALRDAGIEKFNLVYVSSIYPPGCTIISKQRGLKMLQLGQIVYCVMARQSTNEPDRLLSTAIGLALPADKKRYGYMSEHHTFGATAKETADYAEDLAATMLATTLNIPFDSDTAWDARAQVYKASGKIFKTQSIAQSMRGDKRGQWSTVIAAAVFIL